MLTSNLFGTCRGIQNERCKERLCVLRYGMQFHDLAYSKNSALLGYYAASRGNFLYHNSLRNNPEERCFELLRGGRLNFCLI